MSALRKDALDVAAGILATMGLRGRTRRQDANATAYLARQLEVIKTQTYDVLYVPVKARRFIPVDSSIPPGAQSFRWAQWDWFGMASIIANGATSIPFVDVLANWATQTIKPIADAYKYTTEDLRAAIFTGIPLDTKRAIAARQAVENRIESIASIGDADNGLPGMLNNANVPLVTPTTGTWASATASQMLADLNKLATAVRLNTKGTQEANTILLALASYNLISTTPMSVNDNRTVLTVFLQNMPQITLVDYWYPLDLANAGGNGPRAVAYARNPMTLGLVVPLEFRQLPPQAQLLSFVVPCEASCGGVQIYYPLGLAYMDGL